MKFGWQSERERILKGLKISAAKKLEGLKLMNELADGVLTKREKIVRRKLKESRFD